MSIISKVPTTKTKMTSQVSPTIPSSKKLDVKNIIPKIQFQGITDPIDSTRASKTFTKNLNLKSAVKAGIVFFTTIGAYYVAKTTGVFSYLWEAKNSNSKDINSV